MTVYTEGPYKGLTDVEAGALSSEELQALRDAHEEERVADLLAGSTWAPMEHDAAVVAAILSGTLQQQAPSLIDLGTGKMLYEGKVHSLAGESGAGKSMFAAQATIEVIEKAGGEVFYFDIETTYEDLLLRLHSIGFNFSQLDQLHYANPTQAVSLEEVGILAEQILQMDVPVLVVVDSAGEALNLQGHDSNTEEVSNWYRNVAREFARAGAAVLLIDHTPKKANGSVDFAIGSQRKRAAIDVQFILEAKDRFSRTQPGYSSVRVTKDRYGFFTSGREVARMAVEINRGTRVSFAEPVAQVPTNEDGSTRYTGLMEAISALVEKEGPTSKAVVKDPKRGGIPGDTNHKLKAIEQLVSEGYLELGAPVSGHARLVHLKRYLQADDPLSDKYVGQTFIDEIEEG